MAQRVEDIEEQMNKAKITLYDADVNVQAKAEACGIEIERCGKRWRVRPTVDGGLTITLQGRRRIELRSVGNSSLSVNEQTKPE